MRWKQKIETGGKIKVRNFVWENCIFFLLFLLVLFPRNKMLCRRAFRVLSSSNRTFLLSPRSLTFAPLLSVPKRSFSTDQSDWHDDFKTIRKKYEAANKPKSAEEYQKIIKESVESSPVVVFMKGTPEAPRCGFSARAIEILRAQGELAINKNKNNSPLHLFDNFLFCLFFIFFLLLCFAAGVKNIKGVDVLADDNLRSAIKEYTCALPLTFFFSLFFYFVTHVHASLFLQFVADFASNLCQQRYERKEKKFFRNPHTRNRVHWRCRHFEGHE
jgi:glutaredoxin-related protein